MLALDRSEPSGLTVPIVVLATSVAPLRLKTIGVLYPLRGEGGYGPAVFAFVNYAATTCHPHEIIYRPCMHSS